MGVSAFISSSILNAERKIPPLQMESEQAFDTEERKAPRNGNRPPPEGDHPDKPGKKPTPPSPLMVHLSNLIISCLITTFIETLIFAQTKEEEIVKSKNENLQTELKLLKSQINPHFLFNSLNNIYALSVIDSNKTQQSISNLSDMLRYVLYECKLPVVSIRKEITYIQIILNPNMH